MPRVKDPSSAERAADRAGPLVIDLDADLLGGDLSAELFWGAVRDDWRALLPGRRRADHAIPDVALLAYDECTLSRLRDARRAGRETVLAAPDPILGAQVADALGLFDRVVPCAEAAAAQLHRPTRPRLPVVAEALRAMRPHQWVKNLLVFLPMVLAQQIDASTFGLSLLAFISFSMIASAVYLLNDLIDLPTDRRHKTKRARPFASGRLPLATGGRLVPWLFAGGVVVALLGGAELFGVLLLYSLTTTAYSLYFKGKLGADIIVLAALYSLRILAGAAAVGIVPSMWLLSFSIFLFLSLGAVKRLSELVDLETENSRPIAEGRAYRIEDRPVVAMIATSAGFLAVLVLALYIDSPEVGARYAAPGFLWGIGLVLLYWISRIVLLSHRGQVDQDPVTFALRDRVSRWAGLASAALYLAAVLA